MFSVEAWRLRNHVFHVVLKDGHVSEVTELVGSAAHALAVALGTPVVAGGKGVVECGQIVHLLGLSQLGPAAIADPDLLVDDPEVTIHARRGILFVLLCRSGQLLLMRGLHEPDVLWLDDSCALYHLVLLRLSGHHLPVSFVWRNLTILYLVAADDVQILLDRRVLDLRDKRISRRLGYSLLHQYLLIRHYGVNSLNWFQGNWLINRLRISSRN